MWISSQNFDKLRNNDYNERDLDFDVIMNKGIEQWEYYNDTIPNDWAEETIFSVVSEESSSGDINNNIRREKEAEKFKQGKLIENLQELLMAPDVEYRYYWWSWSLSNDVLDQIGELEILRSWTNVDWIDSRIRRQELVSQWMDVWFVWNKPSYVISNIDGKDKYSEWYNNCTWIVLLWKDEDWRYVSMLSHQNPWYFLSDKEFENDIVEKLRRFAKNCKNWSFDAFIVWWNVWTPQKDQIYKKSVWYLSKIIQMELKKEPKILSPNNNVWTVTIKVETQQNKIIILQPKQN